MLLLLFNKTSIALRFGEKEKGRIAVLNISRWLANWEWDCRFAFNDFL